MILFLWQVWSQAHSVLQPIIQLSAAWLIILGAVVLYGYCLITRQIPMFLVALIMAACMFIGGRWIGIDEGRVATMAIVAQNNAKAKADAEARIVDMSEQLNDISNQLEATEREKKLQADASKKLLTDTIARLSKKPSAKENSNAGQGELASVDNGTRCLSVTVPVDVVRVAREAEKRSLGSGNRVSEDSATGQGPEKRP